MKTSISIISIWLAFLGSHIKLGFGLPFLSQPPSQGGLEVPKYQFLFPTPILPLPKKERPSPSPSPNGFPKLNDDEKKCVQSFHDKGQASCLQDLGNSYQTQRLSISPPCCAALEGVDDKCRPALHFQNTFFQMAVQQYCSKGAAADVGPGPGPPRSS